MDMDAGMFGAQIAQDRWQDGDRKNLHRRQADGPARVARLGANGCGAFDVNAACSGFLYALSIADITVATVLMQVALVAETPLDRWPGLAAHYAAMQALPLIAGPYEAAEKMIRRALPTRFDLT